MKQTGDHRIHVEFADFTSLEFFSLFEKYVVRGANSLGMNEQELLMLIDYWNGKNVTEVKDSKPSFKKIIDQTK